PTRARGSFSPRRSSSCRPLLRRALHRPHHPQVEGRTMRHHPISLAAALVAAGALACGSEPPSSPLASPDARLAATPNTAVRGITDIGTLGSQDRLGVDVHDAG